MVILRKALPIKMGSGYANEVKLPLLSEWILSVFILVSRKLTDNNHRLQALLFYKNL